MGSRSLEEPPRKGSWGVLRLPGRALASMGFEHYFQLVCISHVVLLLTLAIDAIVGHFFLIEQGFIVVLHDAIKVGRFINKLMCYSV